MFKSGKNGDTRGKVFAIEPNPDVFKVLEINAALNSHICDIIPLRIAISDADCEIVINDHGNANCNGGIISDTFSNELQERLKSITGYSFKAHGYTLESFVKKFLTEDEAESLSFIKIDCEGYDKEILRASRDFLVKRRPIIQIEWFDWFSLEESADMFSVISSINYTAINPFTGAVVEYNEKLPDLILLPN
ncbi:FkbM family methyltransferase [Acidocella sp. C78]|uniref:FkbM family methyltransferase n=1 Tax=Acidocella sp. C78 TaxID=1671486 RepID=UPI00191BAD78|nr:FkbM family methyltransferase [Acidocella sp. C78]